MKATTKRHWELDLMRWEGVVIDEDGNKWPYGILRTSRKQALQDAKMMIKELEDEMNEKEIKEILERHAKWLKGEPEGEQANLRLADLGSADLSGSKGIAIAKTYLSQKELQSQKPIYRNLKPIKRES